MHYLTEDPSYVLIVLGIAVLGCLLAVRVTQQGKFLIWAGVLAALAGLIFAVDQFWVTDAERIEGVVYDLARAVEASDVDRIRSHLDDRVSIGMRGHSMDGTAVLGIALRMLKNTHFDFLRVAQLTTEAGSQTKRGSAEFKVTASGTFNEGGSQMPLGSLGTEWSLGFREESPGVWKVTRITAIQVPRDVSRALFGR
jgi:hypothetical protein